MRFTSLFVSALGLVALVGCMKHSYATGAPPGGTVHTERATFYVAGLIGDNTIDLGKLCPDGVAKVQNRMDVKDYCLTACTLSLFAPLTVEVECAGGSAFQLTPDEANDRTAVALLDGPVLDGPVLDGPVLDGPGSAAEVLP